MENNKKNKYGPQERWMEKTGCISKSYKLNKKLVEDFLRACNQAGVSQSNQLSKMMNEFIETVNRDTEKRP